MFLFVVLLFVFPHSQTQVSYECPPQSNLVPVVVNGRNQMCSAPGSPQGCSKNAFCLGALNQRNVFICCAVLGPRPNPTCPNNAALQSSPNGFVDCSSNSKACQSGYSCKTATDGVSRVCCQEPAKLPVCPKNTRLFKDPSGNPKYCHPFQPADCPLQYSCQQALNPSNSFVCCAPSTTPTCPINFQPDLTNDGENIFCDRFQPTGCPSGSTCLLDSITKVSICCKSIPSLNLCPKDKQALLDGRGGVQYCSENDNICPVVGYSCIYSSSYGQNVCCGESPSNVVCADGRQTFATASGKTYSCSPFSINTGCPFGFDCADSNQSGISVCCLSNRAKNLRGKIGEGAQTVNKCSKRTKPFLEGDKPKECTGNSKDECPKDYSCQKNSICCTSKKSQKRRSQISS